MNGTATTATATTVTDESSVLFGGDGDGTSGGDFESMPGDDSGSTNQQQQQQQQNQQTKQLAAEFSGLTVTSGSTTVRGLKTKEVQQQKQQQGTAIDGSQVLFAGIDEEQYMTLDESPLTSRCSGEVAA